MTPQREFRLSVKKANTTLWTAVIVGAVGFAYSIAKGAPVIGIAVAVPVIAFGWWQRRKAVLDRVVKLTVNESGIHAPATTELPVPWTAVRKVMLTSSAARFDQSTDGFIVLDLLGNPRDYKPMEGTYFGGPSLSLKIDGLDATLHDVRIAIEHAAPGVEVMAK